MKKNFTPDRRPEETDSLMRRAGSFEGLNGPDD